MIDVIGADFIHELVGAGEEELNFLPVFLLLHVLMESHGAGEMGV